MIAREISRDGQTNPTACSGHDSGRHASRIQTRSSRCDPMALQARSSTWSTGVGILDYYRLPNVRENFEIIVDDLDENLAVMKHRHAR